MTTETALKAEGLSVRDRAAAQEVRLTAAGVLLVVVLPAGRIPCIIHWGPSPEGESVSDCSALETATRRPNASNGVAEFLRPAVVPEAWTGFMGTPGLEGHRLGKAWTTRFVPTSVDVSEDAGHGGSIRCVAQDPEAGLELTMTVVLTARGLVQLAAAVTNIGDATYTVNQLNIALPVPSRAGEVLDMAGRWAKERVPQRGPFRVGTWLREGRRGRTGQEAATVMVAGEPGFDFDRGAVWGVHVGISGDHRTYAERVFTGERLLGGGELLMPGEVELAPGESYQTPVLWASCGNGLDELAHRFHDELRSRDRHPRSPRPVVMNVWEAVYFDQDLDTIRNLADLAAEVGVERFVLDDGWFGARRNDTAGLGDWQIAEDVWGEGRFKALSDHVRSLGMEFGLWFEPEMVNLDSDLAREHPDWILQADGRMPMDYRHQQVLNLAIPEAFEYIRSAVVSLVREYDIAFIKWDHNRDLIEAGSTTTGRAGVHEQTLATYRLIDQIKDACPGLEIESCSSGGARVDLGILMRTDRVWASDCIDAHERQQIQRWTSQLLPLELIGSHVGADKAHTTGRRLDLSFRAMTALFGHFGIEWNLAEASEDERRELASWVELYKKYRRLLHTGTIHRRDLEDDSLWMTSVVSPDRSRALVGLAQMERPATWPVGLVQLPGLDPNALYRLRPAIPVEGGSTPDPLTEPSWWTESGTVLSGGDLASVGIAVPALHPDHACLIDLERVDSPELSTPERGI